MLENEESDKSTSREVNGKWSVRETMSILDSVFHYEVTVSSRKECNTGIMWQIV